MPKHIYGVLKPRESMKKDTLKAHIFSTVLLILSYHIVFGISEKDSLLTQLTKTYDTSKVKILNRLSQIDTTDKSLKYAKEALYLSKKFNYAVGEFEAYKQICSFNLNRGNYRNALDNAEEAIQRLKERNDSNQFSNSYILMGQILFQMGNYQKSLTYYFQALSIEKRNNDHKRIAFTSDIIGSVYMKLENYKIALRYAKEALLFLAKSTPDKSFYRYLNNIGVVYKNMGQIDSAEYYFRKTLDMSSLTKDNEIKITGYMSLASLYKLKKEYQKSIESYKEAYKLSVDLKSISSQAKMTGNIGVLYLKIDSVKQAEEWLLRGLDLAKKLNNIDLIANISGVLSDLSATNNDYINAYKYLLSHSKLKDSLLIKKQVQEIEKLHFLYQLEQKDKEILFQKQRIELFKQASHTKTIKLYLMVAILILIIVSSFLIFYYQKGIIHDKEKKITTLSLHINFRNKFLQKLKQKIITPKLFSDQQAETITETLDSVAKELNSEMVQTEINQYMETHKNFIIALVKSGYKLTENEKQLCVLIYLNLSTKEIADFQTIAPRSVEVNKYRLKKKIGLSKEENLSDFLKTFS